MREHERGRSTTVREGASYAVFTPSLTVGLPPDSRQIRLLSTTIRKRRPLSRTARWITRSLRLPVLTAP